MDESDLPNYTEQSNFGNQDDRYGNPFDKSSDEPPSHSSGYYEEKSKDIDDDHKDKSNWNNEFHHHPSIDRQDSSKFDDLNTISPCVDTTDSSIGNNFLMAGLCGSDKPVENGIIPLLNDDGHLNILQEQNPPQDPGCAVDCMYYTLLCCECSIL